MGWLDGIPERIDMNLGKLWEVLRHSHHLECCGPWGPKEPEVAGRLTTATAEWSRVPMTARCAVQTVPRGDRRSELAVQCRQCREEIADQSPLCSADSAEKRSRIRARCAVQTVPRGDRGSEPAVQCRQCQEVCLLLCGDLNEKRLEKGGVQVCT